ncbi:MAG TPA: membrane protein insertion efficiency factor YidD [Alphaproteobacteria bacterium]|jgi:putative membrane protein insertion efficiency factor|nr:membrane protein insertion efficiency factor YidD [Alphaproteobacteria bacterium]
MSPLGLIATGLIQAYRYGLSPLLPGSCRYLPSCSEYGLEAVRRHGGLKGGWLALRRIARCHPWGGSGYDPVPGAGRSRPHAQRHARLHAHGRGHSHHHCGKTAG